MAKLLYGEGNCSILGTDIMGVELKYEGSIVITDKTSDAFAIADGNIKIIIFPIGKTKLYLNNLFDYSGNLKILSVTVADVNADRVPTSINRVMDYAELINANSEDLTVNSEELNAGYIKGKIPTKSTLMQKTIPNLHTSKQKVTLYNNDGSLYSGSYHIHLDFGTAMTGAEHDDFSQMLYFKQEKNGKIIDKLISTKNTSSIPQGSSLRRRVRIRRKATRTTRTATRTTRTTPSKGGTGGY